MAKPKKRSSALRNQPGYLTLQRSRFARALCQPGAASSTLMPSAPRWRMALDQVGRLLQSVSEQMQDYSDERPEPWHSGPAANGFHESLDEINELLLRIDDLRSNF